MIITSKYCQDLFCYNQDMSAYPCTIKVELTFEVSSGKTWGFNCGIILN